MDQTRASPIVTVHRIPVWVRKRDPADPVVLLAPVVQAVSAEADQGSADQADRVAAQVAVAVDYDVLDRFEDAKRHFRALVKEKDSIESRWAAHYMAIRSWR